MSGGIDPGAESPLNAFTVDVEEYFQVAAFEDTVRREQWRGLESRVRPATLRLLELLERHDARGTFFVLGWVAERQPGLVRAIAEAGHEVASHGYDHKPITRMTPEEFRSDVRRTKGILEDVTGAEVIGYRAPTYSIVQETLWALEILQEEGYRYDSSIFPIRHDRYGIPSASRFPRAVGDAQPPFIEFPISTVRLLGVNLPFVGGGYLRHFPLRLMIWGMRRVHRVDGQPVIVYVHPWEVDPDQPRIPAGRLTALRHYRNLGRTEARLDELLQRFRFATAREVLAI